MSAWGKTGRVTVKRCGRFHDPEHDRTVRVDGKRTGGIVVKVNSSDDWFVEMFGPDGQSWSENLPSLDAAVLWVLRRVDPALWREERGAWLVRKRRPGEVTVRIDGTERDEFPEHPWLVVDPCGVPRNGHTTILGAQWDARRRAQGALR